MALSFDTHHKVQYKDSILRLSGELTESALYKYMMKESKKGEVVFIDSIVADDEATSAATADIDANYRKGYEQGTANHANFMLTQTPHMEVTRARTLLTPIHNEIGHTFRSLDEVLANRKEQSYVLRELMGRMAKRKERIILDALFAHSVQRGKTTNSPTTVTFPTTQEIAVADDVFDKEVVNEVKNLFEDNYIGAVGEDEPIFMIISPEKKRQLIDNSGDTLHNKDFISASGHFEGATLPNIYGVHMIVHPELKFGRGYEVDGDGNGSWAGGRAVAFTPKWGCYNQFDGLSSQIDKDPGERFQYKLYIEEMINAVRVDDKRIAHIQFGTQS
ncbi:MAG: hypothetical protein HRU26_04315 [Psychroserpens sp.]|nr:hypothetical protein [Psychroserpens sp.]